MNWQIVLVLNVVIFAAAQILIKLIVNRLPCRAQALSLQFLICAGLISLYGLATGNLGYSTDLLLVGTVGFVNAFGTYCQWRAIGLSLSRTSLLRPLANVLAIVLAAIFLAEVAEWNFKLVLGALLCFFAVFLFVSKKTKGENNIRKWLLFVTGMIVIMGVTTFLMKVFSSSVPREQFLTYWYLGAFLGSLPILYLEKQNPFRFPGKLVFLVPLASLAILSFLATQYWAFELTLASRVLPFQLVGITFLPILVGLFGFGEKEELSKRW